LEAREEEEADEEVEQLEEVDEWPLEVLLLEEWWTLGSGESTDLDLYDDSLGVDLGLDTSRRKRSTSAMLGLAPSSRESKDESTICDFTSNSPKSLGPACILARARCEYA